jgi:hypothetical protein
MKRILVLAVFCLLTAFQCFGQGLTVQVQNQGTTLGTFKKWLPINCTTNMTCSFSGGIITLAASGGGGVASGTKGEPYVNTDASTGNATSALYVDASQFSGADACAKINAALVYLTSTVGQGGTVDARALANSTSSGSPCAADPGADITTSAGSGSPAPGNAIVILLGSGIYYTAVPWTVGAAATASVGCKSCIYIGEGRNATVIRAGTGFPTNSPILVIGDGTVTVQGAGFVDLQTDDGAPTPPTGVYGAHLVGCDEQCGLTRVRVSNCSAGWNQTAGNTSGATSTACVLIDGSSKSTSNGHVLDSEVFFLSTNTSGAHGVEQVGTSAQYLVDRVTVIGGGGTGAGFACAGSFTGCAFNNIHAESLADMAYFAASSWGSVRSGVAHSTITNALHIASSLPVIATDLSSNNATNMINNSVTSYTLASGAQDHRAFYSNNQILLDTGGLSLVGAATINDANGNSAIGVTATSSAVDYLNVTNGAAGSPGTVSLAPVGSDTNIAFNLVGKGTGNVGLGAHAVVTPAGGVSATNITDSALTQYDTVSAGSGGLLAGIHSPSTKGIFSFGYNLSTDAAAAPTVMQRGMGGHAVTGSTSSDTVLFTDINGIIDHDVGGSAANTETLPTPATLENTAFAVRYCNHSAFTDTFKATTYTIQLNSQTAVAGSTGVSVPPATCITVHVDPNSSSQWLADSSVAGGSCTEAWGGSGTSFALSSGDDSIANNVCYNDSGHTRFITAVKCLSDNSSNTTTVNPTFGSAGTGTTILSGALTCGSSNAMSSSGTVSNGSWTTGAGIDPVMGGTLTGTHIAMIVDYTY